MKGPWQAREFSTVVILVLEMLFFTWWLWPDGPRPHPFLNAGNFLLILKYSSIYGIAAIGAAIVIISGGIDLAPGAVMALAGVVAADLFVVKGWGLGPAMAMGVLVGMAIRAADVRAGRARAAAAVHRHARHDGDHARHRLHHHRRAVLRRVEPAASAAGGRSACPPIGWRRSSCSSSR